MFRPTPVASTISKASHFQKVAVPVTVRFSNFAGIATLPDIHPLSNPRGMAIKFHLASGDETNIVSHSFNGFPSSTAEEFRQFMLALGASGPGTEHPTPADRYLATHPVAKTFLETQQPPPISYATLTYYGVNSFRFTNATGAASIGRYRIEPKAGNHFLKASNLSAAKPNYLQEEIRTRVAAGSIWYDLRLQLAEAGDKTQDPSIG